MTRFELPFEVQYDAAGHNVVGITFDEPIPWPRWEGGSDSPDERIAAAVRGEADPSTGPQLRVIRTEIGALRKLLAKSNPDLVKVLEAASDVLSAYDEWAED